MNHLYMSLLHRMGEPTLQRLALRFGVKDSQRGQQAAGLCEALTDPQKIASGLAGLSADALVAFALIIDVGEIVDQGQLASEIAKVLRSPARASAALEELGRNALLMGEQHAKARAGFPDYLCAPFVASVPPIEGFVPETQGRAQHPISPRWNDALLMAFFSTHQPRINRDGAINTTDARKLEQCVPASLHPHLWSGQARLASAGVFAMGERLRLSQAGSKRYLSSSFAAWYKRSLKGKRSDWSWRRVAAWVEQASGRWIRRSSIDRLLACSHLSPHAAYLMNQPVETRRATLVATLLLEEGLGSDDEPLYRAPRASLAVNERSLILQPNFEILVPPETPLPVLGELAAYADLVKADVFGTFRLSESSIRKAKERGAPLDALFDLLRARTVHAVPQNVEQTVRGWFDACASVQIGYGMVITAEPKHATAIATKLAQRHVAFQLLKDTVFLVHDDFKAMARDILRGLKLNPTDIVLEGDPSFGGFSEDDIEQSDDDYLEGADSEVADQVVGIGGSHRASTKKLWQSFEAGFEASRNSKTALLPAIQSVRSSTKPAQTPTAMLADLKRCCEQGTPVRIRYRSPDGVEGTPEQDIIALVDRVASRGGHIYAEVQPPNDDRGLAIRVDHILSVSLLVPAASTKVGRNDPCPCGSGKKFKKCCDAPDHSRA